MLFRQQQTFLQKTDTEMTPKVKRENFKIKDNNFSIEAYEKHLQEMYIQHTLAMDTSDDQSFVRKSNFKSLKKFGRGDQSSGSEFLRQHNFNTQIFDPKSHYLVDAKSVDDVKTRRLARYLRTEGTKAIDNKFKNPLASGYE
jgi:hypothetical protein